jgi:hypothetical protein
MWLRNVGLPVAALEIFAQLYDRVQWLEEQRHELSDQVTRAHARCLNLEVSVREHSSLQQTAEAAVAAAPSPSAKNKVKEN